MLLNNYKSLSFCPSVCLSVILSAMFWRKCDFLILYLRKRSDFLYVHSSYKYIVIYFIGILSGDHATKAINIIQKGKYFGWFFFSENFSDLKHLSICQFVGQATKGINVYIERETSNRPFDSLSLLSIVLGEMLFSQPQWKIDISFIRVKIPLTNEHLLYEYIICWSGYKRYHCIL